jgi:hypothetical protein
LGRTAINVASSRNRLPCTDRACCNNMALQLRVDAKQQQAPLWDLFGLGQKPFSAEEQRARVRRSGTDSAVSQHRV